MQKSTLSGREIPPGEMSDENGADEMQDNVPIPPDQAKLPPSHRKMPNHKRGPWSQAEDDYLVKLVREGGPNNWVRISNLIRTRSPKQCRERFHQNLKPSLIHDPITVEEGREIERLVGEMGKRWAEIARRLPGRSDNAVKNWWNGGMNRRKRQVGRQTEMPGRDMPQIYDQRRQHHMPTSTSHYERHMDSDFPRRLPAPFPSETRASHGYHNLPRPIQTHAADVYNQHVRTYDTPLPSPSGMSVEGAPSLVSDCSSSSTRSPHMVESPVSLPPLVGPGPERRRSSAPMLQFGGSAYASDDSQYAMPDHHEPKHSYQDSHRYDYRPTAPAVQAPIYDSTMQQRPYRLPLAMPAGLQSRTSGQPAVPQLPLPSFDLRTLHAQSMAAPAREYPAPRSFSDRDYPSTMSPPLLRDACMREHDECSMSAADVQYEHASRRDTLSPPQSPPSSEKRRRKMSFSNMLT